MKMRLIVGIPVIVAGALGVCYFGWVRYAISHGIDEVWEIDWVMGLWHWFDQRFPVPPGYIKFHGEVERVLFASQVAVGISAAMVVCGFLFVRSRRSKLGFDLGWRWLKWRSGVKWMLVAMVAVLGLSHGWALLFDRTPRIITAICILSGLFWFVLALPMAALALWPRGPTPAGYCGECGYDLRGNVGGLVCPECGASIRAASKGLASLC